MSASGSVVVLGGGLSGMAAALELARSGMRVTLVERGKELGGLAGTFHNEGHFYPLAYHHILHRDRTLLFFLELLGALPGVRWRKIRMLFRVDGRLLDLAHPVDFLRFPMSPGDKLRFVRLMLRSFRKGVWDEWLDRSARELVDSWGGPGVRRAIFDPLCRLKFDLPASDVSAAWLGSRLRFREGSAPLGYIPGSNWTKVLCDGLTRELKQAGVTILTETRVTRLDADASRMRGAQLEDGRRLEGDQFVSSLPTEVYRELLPADDSPELASIRYTAVVSGVCATRQRIEPDFYWMNLASPRCSASGLFMLNSLNPSIGAPGDACLNFVTHVPGRQEAYFRRSDDELWDGYLRDFREIFGFELQPAWRRLIRIPTYSPVFLPSYRNPPIESPRLDNVYFAGNYRTFPSIASTGTALGSGLEAAQAILAGRGQTGELRDGAARFRLGSMPRA